MFIGIYALEEIIMLCVGSEFQVVIWTPIFIYELHVPVGKRRQMKRFWAYISFEIYDAWCFQSMLANIVLVQRYLVRRNVWLFFLNAVILISWVILNRRYLSWMYTTKEEESRWVLAGNFIFDVALWSAFALNLIDISNCENSFSSSWCPEIWIRVKCVWGMDH